MRETCARVLAAALMTGAIAAVVAMSAVLNTPRDDSYPLTAPPSSLQRSVRVPAPAAPPRPAHAERLVIAHSVHRSVARPVVVRSVPIRGVVRAPRPGPKPASAGPATPAPSPPEPRELASTAPPPEVKPPAAAPSPQPPAGNDSKGKAKGKAKGHDKGHESDAEQSPAQAPPVEAAQPPASTSGSQDESGSEQDHGHGNGHGHDKGERDD